MKSFNKYSLLGAVAVASIGLSIASAGHAYTKLFGNCNGSLVRWRGDIDLHRNQFSINTTDTISAYMNGFGQWNQYSGLITSGDLYVRPISDQSFDSADNAQNEMSLALRSEIDGVDGVTFVDAGACGIGANDIDEADIVLANDMAFWQGWGENITTTGGNYGRTAWVHEFGHFFGFGHQDDNAANLSQMRTSGMGAITGGQEASVAWGTDIAGMNAFYGMAGSTANLMPSATLVPTGVGAAIITLDPLGTFNVCRGSVQSVTFAIGNAGEANAVNFSGTVRMDQIAPFSGGYTNTHSPLATFGATSNAFNGFLTTVQFNVPVNATLGTYFIYIKLDTGGIIPEWVETDNTTVSAKKLRVVTC